MVPKESVFNQSVAAHYCHNVETIRHPNSTYVNTKLYGTSTCGCNNNTIFSKRAMLTFLTVDVCRAC